MDIITGNVGWIEVICGPMFSGKSEELIRRLRRAMIARKRVEVFKPTIDKRYSDDEIVSHGDLRMKSQVVANSAEIAERIDWRSEVVGIDEANFMGPGLVDVAQRLADSGKQVIIAGLDTDYMGRPFAPMPDLLAHAESIVKTLAICVLLLWGAGTEAQLLQERFRLGGGVGIGILRGDLFKLTRRGVTLVLRQQ